MISSDHRELGPESNPPFQPSIYLMGSNMIMAGQWYSSSTVLGVAGIAAVLAVGILTVWVTLRAANPNRRLDYSMTVAPLLNTVTGDVEITWQGEKLNNPHVLEIRLDSHSRRDIAPDDFAGGPFQLDVGARIITILQTTKSFDKVRINDKDRSILEVAPTLIGKHQGIIFTLLADGNTPRLASPAAVLRDVTLKARSGDASSRPVNWLQIAVQTLVTAVAVAVIGIVVVNTSVSAANSGTPAIPTLAAASADLNSSSLENRLSAIHELWQTMQTTLGDQPAVIQTLSAFIREHSPAKGRSDVAVTPDIQAALTVLSNRNSSRDNGMIIDLDNANLSDANLTGANLASANFIDADIGNADLTNANLRNANLTYAYLGEATLTGTQLANANLMGTSFPGTVLCKGTVPTRPAQKYSCIQ